MRDVAAAAGVSLSTVSLVINGKPGVSPDRRERVLETIMQLGYTPDLPQNNPVETKVFGLLMESLSEASRSEGFYTRIVTGIEDSVYALGYQVLLHVYRPEIDPISSIRELMGREIDGLIIANDGDVTPEVIEKGARAGLPIVLIENYQPTRIHSITADNLTAGLIVTEPLIDLGHTRIGALGGPPKYSSLRDRMRGHQIAMIEHGLPIDPRYAPKPISGNPRKGYVQMQQLLALPDPPTAVFAVSDRLQTCRQATLYHGVIAIHHPDHIQTPDVRQRVTELLADGKWVEPGSTVVIISVQFPGTPGLSASLQVHRL